MNTLWLDTETYSETPIAAGTYRYAADAELLLTAWAWDDEPAQVVEGEPEGFPLVCFSADRIVAHNAQFDRLLFPSVPVEKWRCTMAQAMAHSLPGALSDLCEILKVPTDKAKAADGKALVQLFCKPQLDGRRLTKQTHPEEWERFKEYCRLDVEAMRAVAKRLPKWNYSVFT